MATYRASTTHHVFFSVCWVHVWIYLGFYFKNIEKKTVRSPDQLPLCINRTSTYIFEGVCLTHVILTPGVCGREGPSCSCCHHFVFEQHTITFGMSTPQEY